MALICTALVLERIAPPFPFRAIPLVVGRADLARNDRNGYRCSCSDLRAWAHRTVLDRWTAFAAPLAMETTSQRDLSVDAVSKFR